MVLNLAAASIPAGTYDREQAELIRSLYQNIPVIVGCMFLGAVATCVGMAYLAPERASYIWIWFAVSVAVAGWQLALWAWRRRAAVAAGDWRLWARRLTLATFADGARWGFATLWLAAGGQADQMMWVCMVAGGAACASVASLGSYVPAYYALLFPAIVPYLFRAMTLHDPRYWGVAMLGAIVLLGMAWLGRLQSRFFGGALRLRFENLDLAEDLRRQRDLAEHANLAKARFLAAASHDLRQPMHALGMFAAALGRGQLAPEDARLVGDIKATVGAMDGLFGSLLDISKLDAGITQPEVGVFPIQPLLARICREQEAELRGRPIRLRQVAVRADVETDPVLLERMLRNLVSNAVRHTEQGRILVGCRRRGERVSVEVWDTGPGIAPHDQARVFEEFVQLANPERDRTKGLGLGLSITQRLADLLDCPLALRSQLGRGSVFSVAVPRAKASAEVRRAAPTHAPAKGGLVFIIDDDALVLRSTAGLLDSWGYQTVSGASADAVLARAGGRGPDLIICDWRLGNGETALSAIGAIRAASGPGVAALIISGDIGPAQLRAIHATDLPLLHKPVEPSKLRAAIGNLLRRAPEREGGPEIVET